MKLQKSVKKDNKKTASYGRIKITTMGGFIMPIKYRHLKDYEKELIYCCKYYIT